MYILKVLSFLSVQIITILFGLIYTIGGLINKKFSRNFVNIYLIMNTIDGIIFPTFSYFSNKMYKVLCNSKDNEFNIELLSNDSTDNDFTKTNMTLHNQAKAGDNTGTTLIKDTKNNFDLTY